VVVGVIGALTSNSAALGLGRRRTKEATSSFAT